MMDHSVDMDVVEHCELAGVQLTWLRQRAAGDAGHYVVLAANDEPSENARGPLGRQQAMLVFEAMRAALIEAARQQSARLKRIMRRAS